MHYVKIQSQITTSGLSESNDVGSTMHQMMMVLMDYYEVVGYWYLSDYGGGYTVSSDHTPCTSLTQMSNWRCSRWMPCSIRWNSSCSLWWCSSPHWIDPRTYSQEQGACCCYATRWTDDGRTNDATTCSADATTCSADAATCSADAATCSGNASTDNPARVRIRTEVIILLRPHTTLCCMMGK